MAPLIIACGFQTISTEIFRPKGITKGKKLYESRHVTDVCETINEEERKVTGKVLPQTKVTRAPYVVTIELRNDRSISKSFCECKAGTSSHGCKHLAALCIFINNERTVSKTDQPQLWNAPAQSQAEKYKKGSSIDKLFKPKLTTIDRTITYTIDDVENVPEAYLKQNSLFARYLLTEARTREDREISQQEEDRRLRRLENLVKELFKFQSGHKTYKSYDCTVQKERIKLALSQTTCPLEFFPLYKDTVVMIDEWMKICIASVNQSECLQWFTERSKRITCSRKAHQIKTRRERFENLAEQFKNKKFEGKLTEAMAYGITLEPIARDAFQRLTSLTVDTVGLVIKIKQPFLAASPDGIILSEKALLEIKCPYSCRDGEIVNHEKNISNVPYLLFDTNGNIILKETDPYYTQVQASMYVVGLEKCYFFVYSSKDSVLIEIERNEDFLMDLIPKIQYFYFHYFLPVLGGAGIKK